MKWLYLCIQSQIYDCCYVFMFQGNTIGINPSVREALKDPG